MSIIVGLVMAALIVACVYLNVKLGEARLETAEWRRLAVEADKRKEAIEHHLRVTSVPSEVRKAAVAQGVVLPTIEMTAPMPPVKPPRNAGRPKA